MKYYNILKPIFLALVIITALVVFSDLHAKSVQTQRETSEAVMAGMAIMPKIESMEEPTAEAVIQLVKKEVSKLQVNNEKVRSMIMSICLEQAKAEGLF